MFIPSYKKPGGGGYVPCSWSDGTDEEIVEALEQHYAGNCDLTQYWSVGDERVVSLSAMRMVELTDTHEAQNIILVLSNIGGKILSDGVTECCFQVDQKDSLKEGGAIHTSSSNYWHSSARRTWCNNTYKKAFPSTLVGIFKEFINQTGIGGGSSSGTITTNDYFALRAEIEVTNTTSNSVSGEGSQVKWYETSANRIKSMNGTPKYYWLRSPRLGSNQEDCYIYSNGGVYTSSVTTTVYGIAPFGVI